MADTYHAVASPVDDAGERKIEQHPLETTNWINYITISWLDKLVRKGSKAPLTAEDIWPLARADRTEVLYSHHTFRGRILVAVVLFTLYGAFGLVQPIAVKSMLQFLQADGDSIETDLGIENGYILALVLFVVTLVSVSMMDFAGYYGTHLGVNVKTALSHMVYRKTLSLSSKAKAFSSGEVITMRSVDLDRIALAFGVGQWAFVSPVMLTAIYIMLGFQLTALAAFAGAIVMAIFIYFGFATGDTIGKLRQDMLAIQAERVKLTNELLQGVRVVKLYAWEDSMHRLLQEIRLRELQALKRYFNLFMINNVLLIVAPVASLASALLVYVARGHPLTVPVAFTELAYINLAKQPCGIFSIAIVATMDALASCRRLSNFFNTDEIDHDVPPPSDAPNDAPQPSISPVEILQADFTWDTALPPTLKSIQLKVEPKTLTMIVGAVGSGKSSLLSAILGDIHLTQGSRRVHGRFSYASQEAWIQHASVKDNILFEAAFQPELYRQVLAACQLNTDMAALPNGDETEIGERGINLSGGQKARVGLARAAYHQEADVVLLDDPLSALDAHVANAVFADCIQRLLHDKTTLLVLTSHYHLLPHADRILVMADGKIAADGSYADIHAQFPTLLQQSMQKPLKTPMDGQETSEDTQDATADDAADDDAPEDVCGGGLVAKEDKVDGQVTWATYRAYFGSSGYDGLVVALVLLVLCTLAQVALTLTDWFMGVWARHGPESLAYGGGYVGFALGSFLLIYLYSVFVLFTAVLCSKSLHATVLRHALDAPVPTFFDVTPVGRILKSFSSDMDMVDSTLPQYILFVIEFFFSLAAILVVCAVSAPYVLLLYVPIGAIFFHARRIYNATINEVKRLDGISRSPLVSLVGETYTGLSTIRAFDKTATFALKQQRAVDYNIRFSLTQAVAPRWFQMRLDALGTVVVAGVAFLAVATKSSIGLAAAGLALTYSSQLCTVLSRLATFAALVDSFMTSVERLHHYQSLEKEETAAAAANDKVTNWPSQGAIAFEGYSMRYRAHLDLVLNDIAFAVEPGHQVGICGRTGSGKSSLMAALFRMVPSSSGRITIDGVLSLKSLRSGLTIIPQDPVLFSGSVRLNLDPTNDADDADLWTVLKRVHLSDAIPSLEFEIAEKGSNLSVGQRQLVCIARALLRRSKVVVLDEATANIDPESDCLIQQTMRECFENVTRLIIAHRLDTILDSDRILVLDAGAVKEYGTPSELFANKDSAFAQLAQHANIDVDKLR
ncbi:hypothetical protein Ae201684P_007951 [Aphanomyces euteiches]|nr:hypothetical protein Ae201684P_007951 [Aphanomyces euteiches]